MTISKFQVRLASYSNGPLDEINSRLILERLENREALRSGRPLCGDYIRFPCGKEMRFSRCWENGAQISESGSFHLNSHGDASFSGSLYPSIPYETLTEVPSEEGLRPIAQFWIFRDNYVTAHNALHFFCGVRVFETTETWDY